MKKFISVLIIIIIIILGVVGIVHLKKQQNTQPPVSTSTPIATVSYVCNEGKTITASFYNGTTTSVVQPGQPPVPTGTVALTLSDGRSMTLAQTISADGNRYASPDESFVFWSKGNGALVLENNQEQSYIGCIKVAPQTDSLSTVYENGSRSFSIRYPQGYTVDDSYVYQALGLGKNIHGTKFTIPATLAEGTNLNKDSYISVEEIPQTVSCTARKFVGSNATVSTTTDNGTDYSVATSSDAGAGNRYEETVYALPGTNPCIAVRYFIHYGVLENYPQGTVKEFDKQALLNQFDAIRRTLVVNE